MRDPRGLVVQHQMANSIDGRGENFPAYVVTTGVVINNDDPLQNNRLQIFCPSLGDNPKKIHHIPWTVYSTPFGGVVNNPCFSRGNDVGPSESTGAVAYGFQGLPEQGASVLVTLIDGDPRRRVYLGSIPEHQDVNTLLHGRFKWNGGEGIPDGPLTGKSSPVEPTYTNWTEAFRNRTDREWRTRGAEYQVCAVREDIGEIPNSIKSTYLDEQYDKISAAEPDDWVKPILGAHGYDWSGNKATGAFLTARVYGIGTPGFHSISMDDRAFNSRIKFRTTSGHQVILDDTNERIYVMTSQGNSWVEMDAAGNLDFYGKRRYSVHTENDINFTSDKTVRIMGKEGVYIYAGDNKEQSNLESNPPPGEVRIQSEADMHIATRQNLRQYSLQDTLVEIGGKKCETIGDSLYLQVQNDINIITNTGGYWLTVSGNLHELVQGNAKKFAAGKMAMASRDNAEMFSYAGKMDIGSQNNINIKSMVDDVTLEAVGSTAGGGSGQSSVIMRSPNSQAGISSSGIYATTSETMQLRSEGEAELSQGEAVPQDSPTPPVDIGECDLGSSVSLDGLSGVDLAAAAAYNAGFRGDDLVAAVAIAGAESSWNPDAVGDVGLQNDKWGASYGFWQIRSLRNPGDFGYPDTLRVAEDLPDPQNNADAAFAISNGGSNWGPWSTYPTSYLSYMSTAEAAVSALCGGPMAMGGGPDMFTAFNSDNILQDGNDNHQAFVMGSAFPSLSGGLFTKNIIKLSGSNVDIQGVSDVNFKNFGGAFSTAMFDEIVPKLDSTIFNLNALSAFSAFSFTTTNVALAALEAGGTAAPSIAAIAAAILGLAADIEAIVDLGLDIEGLLPPNCDPPPFDPIPEQIFFFEGYN